MKGPSGPRQWIGLGSEREIEEESVREMRKTVDSYVRSIFFLIFTLFLIFILYLSLVQPLCLFVVICFSFFFVVSYSTHSPESAGNLACRSVFPTAALQMLRLAS